VVSLARKSLSRGELMLPLRKLKNLLCRAELMVFTGKLFVNCTRSKCLTSFTCDKRKRTTAGCYDDSTIGQHSYDDRPWSVAGVAEQTVIST